MNTTELKELSMSEQRDFTQAYREGKALDYLRDRAIEIQRDDNGEIKKIIFTIGGPNVWLDFDEYPGAFVVAYLTEQATSYIPTEDWKGIQMELEEL